MKISVNMDILIISFYGNIKNMGNIIKYQMDILPKISINNKLFKNYKTLKGFQKMINK